MLVKLAQGLKICKYIGMIGFIKGKVLQISSSRMVVEAGNVGYLLHCIPTYLTRLRTDTEVALWVHTAVRENDISLYGFETESELEMFEMLLGVSGIGPKSALTVLGVAGLSALEEAITSGETTSLTKVSGVGKKTADKIVLELGGKLVGKSGSKLAQEDSDIFDALKSLGYRDRDIGEAMKEMPKDLDGAQSKIKWALKSLGKN